MKIEPLTEKWSVEIYKISPTSYEINSISTSTPGVQKRYAATLFHASIIATSFLMKQAQAEKIQMRIAEIIRSESERYGIPPSGIIYLILLSWHPDFLLHTVDPKIVAELRSQGKYVEVQMIVLD